MTTSQPLIDPPTSAFLQGGVSIIAASSDLRNHPVIVRAVGCLIPADRRRVTLLVPASDPFADAVRASRRIAATFTQPSTHETFQLKGEDATLEPRQKTDLSLTERYSRAFAADVCPLGYTEELIHALLWWDPDDLTRVTFRPTAAFLQTPGPRAGVPLRAE